MWNIMSKLLRLSDNSVWRSRSFFLYWLGTAISTLGTSITAVILPILVYQLTKSALQTSLLTALDVLPYLALGLFAGALADRVNRKRLMVICNLINALLVGSIPLAFAFHVLTLLHVYTVSLLVAITVVWFDAADFGALPTIVGQDHIVSANSYVWSTSIIIGIIGPSMAGLLATLLGAPLAISMDALSYVLCAIAFLFIARAFNIARSKDESNHSFIQRTLRDIQEGLQFLLHHSIVRTFTLLGAGNAITGGAVFGLLVVYGVRGLGLAQSGSQIGLLFTSGAIGSLLASLALPHITKRIPAGRITLISLCINPMLLLSLALTSQPVVGFLLYGLWNICYSLIAINGISVRQVLTPDRLRSRVNTTARMLSYGWTPVGAILGGILAQVTTIHITFMIMALAVTASAIAGLFSPLRKAQIQMATAQEGN